MDCSICYNPIVKRAKLPCEHIFCRDCLGKWSAKTCPLCRQPYTTINPHKHKTRFQYNIIKTNQLKSQLNILLENKEYDEVMNLLLQNRWFIQATNLYDIVNTIKHCPFSGQLEYYLYHLKNKFID